MSRKPSFGITTYGYAPQDILNLARHAERLGFEGLWFGEHYVIPKTYEGHHPSRKETPADQNDARDKAIIGIFDEGRWNTQIAAQRSESVVYE